MGAEFSGSYSDVAKYKFEQARDDLEAAEILWAAGKYKAANNRAYYSCYHAVDAVLALEPRAFKKHKDTLAYFNKTYVKTEIFPKEIGRQLARLEVIRHKSDYDDFYIASGEEAADQIEIANRIILLVGAYLTERERHPHL